MCSRSRPKLFVCSYQATQSKVFLYDNVWETVLVLVRCYTQLEMPTVDCRHDETNLSRVSCTSKMSVDLLRLVLIQRNETIENVIARSGVFGAARLHQVVKDALIHGRILLADASIVRKVITHGANGELLQEAIFFIEEENDRCLDEPS